MNKESPFEDITPVPNIKIGYLEREAYLTIIDRKEKQIESDTDTIMALMSKIEMLEKNQRPIGHWIRGREIGRTMWGNIEHVEYKDFTCSKCGLVLDYLLYHFDGSPFYKFCPECGAEMRGEK